MRSSQAKDGYTISDNGLLLMDVEFGHVEDVKILNDNLRSIVGVTDISIFYNIATKALVVGKDGVRVMNK